MKLALDALYDIIPANANSEEIRRIQQKAITTLREALAQQFTEDAPADCKRLAKHGAPICGRCHMGPCKYTAPQAQTAQPQQELGTLKRLAAQCPELNMANYNSDDVDALNNWAIEVATTIDALALALAQQEPVAWIDMTQWPPIRWRDGMLRKDVAQFDGQGLYTSPPASKPLTDDEIEREWQFLHDEEDNPPDHHDFARAIEAKHGIKGDA